MIKKSSLTASEKSSEYGNGNLFLHIFKKLEFPTLENYQYVLPIFRLIRQVQIL